ncbi:MAG TPA: teichoic acid biosynthesis protein C [Thermomonospora sp.]|nr:teichoic acid biosynthesis protein C [Thermomonospora sp.]
MRKTMLVTAPVSAVVLVLAAGSAAGHDKPAGLPDSPRFDLRKPAYPLFLHRWIKHQTVMQSFGFDVRNKRLFVAQLTNGRSADRNGDLTISQLDFSGRLKGHMYLKGFGHGVAIGVEPAGDASYLWVEVDPRGESARGTRLARFRFTKGKTLRNTSSALAKYQPVRGARAVTATIDPVNGRLAMRYNKNGWRVAVYRLADIKARRYSRRLTDVRLPSQGDETFQGYALYGRYLYTYYGNAYSRHNPPPGNARIAAIDLRTGKRVAGPTLTRAGRRLTYREPEGMAVYRTSSGEVRLFFGFASNRVRARQVNLFYKKAFVR